MSLLRLSFNLLRRDWRSGEWRVLMLALVLAVGSLATVGFFADRVRMALAQQAASLLGADLRITSTRPVSAEYRAKAVARGLQVVESRTFPSMVSRDGRVLLCEIQSVERGYPLRGEIVVGRDSSRQSSFPVSGDVWADERLMRRLDLRVGDEVGIGARHFRVAARVVKDVDQSVGFASFAPRVLINDADLSSTGLLQEGSRISYRMMFAGDAVQLAAFRAALRLTPNEKMEDVRDARPEIRTALERAEHFLGLAALTSAILAGVAIALAARRYVTRHLDGCAVMRCLGAQQGQLMRLFLYQFLLAGVLAVLVGLLLGYLAQDWLVGHVMPDALLPMPGVMPALKAAISGFALLLGFAFLPLLQLGSVPPLRVLRRELGAPEVSAWLLYGLAVLVLAGLFVWQAGGFKLGLVVLGGLLAGLLVFAGLARGLLRGLTRFVRWTGARHALNNLSRQGAGVAVQVVALSLGGMALLVLTLVRADLLESWQGKLPIDAPNRFVVNIQPEQLADLREFFTDKKIPVPQWLPMVKGRLLAINDKAVSGEAYAEPRARSLVEREFNLSYADKMPEWNELVQGRWWKPSLEKGRDGEEFRELSVEEGIAKTLGMHLGDRLTYDAAGSRFTATVTSLRKVQWDSMKVNFFVIAPPRLLQDAPVSYLTSFYLPPAQAATGDALTLKFPNLLLIDTGEVIAQVRRIIDQVSQTISVVFLFTLASGLAVLYAALLSTQDERLHEAAILRTLGADNAWLRRLHLTEFAVIGLMSGLFAAASAVMLGWGLGRFVLEIPVRQDGFIWLAGLVGGMVLVMLSGWLTTRKLGRMSPMRILRSE
ncbi:MAG: FtsX-like permease family protein [Gallionella sp.]|jgi:putative ABC transport system permease protein